LAYKTTVSHETYFDNLNRWGPRVWQTNGQTFSSQMLRSTTFRDQVC